MPYFFSIITCKMQSATCTTFSCAKLSSIVEIFRKVLQDGYILWNKVDSYAFTIDMLCTRVSTARFTKLI